IGEELAGDPGQQGVIRRPKRKSRQCRKARRKIGQEGRPSHRSFPAREEQRPQRAEKGKQSLITRLVGSLRVDVLDPERRVRGKRGKQVWRQGPCRQNQGIGTRLPDLHQMTLARARWAIESGVRYGPIGPAVDQGYGFAVAETDKKVLPPGG